MGSVSAAGSLDWSTFEHSWATWAVTVMTCRPTFVMCNYTHKMPISMVKNSSTSSRLVSWACDPILSLKLMRGYSPACFPFLKFSLLFCALLPSVECFSFLLSFFFVIKAHCVFSEPLPGRFRSCSFECRYLFLEKSAPWAQGCGI